MFFLFIILGSILIAENINYKNQIDLMEQRHELLFGLYKYYQNLSDSYNLNLKSCNLDLEKQQHCNIILEDNMDELIQLKLID